MNASPVNSWNSGQPLVVTGTEALDMIAVTHEIAGIIFRTESNVWLPRLQEKPFEWFCVSDVEPQVRHRIHQVGPDSMTLPPPTREERKRLSRDTRCSPGGLESPLLRSPMVRARFHTCLDRPEQVDIRLDRDQVIVRDFAQRELDLFYTPELGEHHAEAYVATNYPRIFSTFLPHFSAILCHSASVIRNDKAAVFLASDGGGKTTVVKLSTDVPILHDDQVVFRKEDAIVNAHATPIGKNTSGPHHARIGGLFLLEKAPRFELLPLAPSDLLQCLWAGHLGYTSFLTRSLKTRAFDVLYDACYQAPAYRLRFPKDYMDWDAIDAAMVR